MYLITDGLEIEQQNDYSRDYSMYRSHNQNGIESERGQLGFS